MRVLVAVLTILAGVAVCHGRTITVDDDGPADFNNIQAAIDDANDGDTVIVSEGRYYENINFSGKNILLRSTDPLDSAVVEGTIIDGSFLDSVVMFSGTETADCALSGLTITKGKGHGNAVDRRGGGIYGNGTLATIQHNIISQNWAAPDIGPGGGLGGGLYDCDGVIRHNLIMDNRAAGDMADVMGGGLYGCDGVIHNNVISGNHACCCCGGGGGLAYCNAQITHNTIYGNSGEWGGGGLLECTGMISNCIIWANTPSQIAGSSKPSYSCIQGVAGVGNIAVDPCFADPNNGDFHLKSQAGRWNSNSESWVTDDATSPCVDAGDPMSPIGLEPFPNGGIVNMGAYGGTAEASKSWFGGPACETIVAGDINGDCAVNFKDFALLGLHWVEPNEPVVIPEEAWDPSPANWAEYVPTEGAMTWKLGSVDTNGYTVSYDVYIGTDLSDVVYATTASPEYVGNVCPESYEYTLLSHDVEYFWRVDTKLTELVPPFTSVITPGNIWSFRTWGLLCKGVGCGEK